MKTWPRPTEVGTRYVGEHWLKGIWDAYKDVISIEAIIKILKIRSLAWIHGPVRTSMGPSECSCLFRALNRYTIIRFQLMALNGCPLLE